MFKRVAALLCGVILLGALPVRADEWDKKTTVTFSMPVELPGIALPPGTYVFKLADSTSDRHIVQVFNNDGTKLLTTVLAIPNYRLEPTGDTVLKFDERPLNTPEAIRAWFYPGDNFGQEFVYPKRQGAELAAKTNVPVLTSELPPAPKPEELVKAPVTVAEPVKPVETAPPVTAAVKPAPPATPPMNLTPAPVETPPVVELPKTASPVPLTGLSGFLTIGLGGLLRRLARR